MSAAATELASIALLNTSAMSADQVVWNGDTRYPGPPVFAAPACIEGIPTQAELDAMVRMYTWGELKEIIQTGDLEQLSRNKELQSRYEAWIKGQKDAWGSTENYLINARLPWGNANTTANGARKPHIPEPTYDQHTAFSHPEIDLTPSTNPDRARRRPDTQKGHTRAVSGSAAVAQHALRVPGSPRLSAYATSGSVSHIATAPSSQVPSPPDSGASTPSSVAYVPLESVLPKLRRKLERERRRAESRELGEQTGADISRGGSIKSASSSEENKHEDEEDEPDVFLKFDPNKGLDADKFAVLPNDWPYCVPYGVRHYVVWSRVPIAHPILVDYDKDAWTKVEAEGLGGFTGIVPVFDDEECEAAPSSPLKAAGTGRAGPSTAGRGGWYGVDVKYGGSEMRRWAGVQYEAHGGHEVGNMVKGLWDERGWETIWFVNPARLQSVPGYAHFHVFARRKSPGEIDLCEMEFATMANGHVEEKAMPNGLEPTEI